MRRICMPLIIGLYVTDLYATNYWIVCDGLYATNDKLYCQLKGNCFLSKSTHKWLCDLLTNKREKIALKSLPVLHVY